MKHILIFFLVLMSLNVSADDWEENADIGKLFKAASVNGTFVLFDVKQQQYTGYNRERAVTPFIPASTFKIPNTLIGLSIGSVENVDEILPYGGQPQPMDIWEKDMSLRDAIPISNVPIYQELARRTGLERMQANVRKLDYGNADIGEVVDRFWLDGPLRISALEQTSFLARLAQGELPFPVQAQADTREIVQLEQDLDWTLYAKTGWGNDIGWWVGWVTKGDRVYSFALNIDMYSAAEANKRIVLGKASLQGLGIL
ncbi:class D beta-lactamase [Hahella ganghwensis]|uniref:class D beta-lactamase n=1 Tax=Hahella ganghwensis TaxID=286420 RepID=UPI0004781E78|nr:class D beta-lactamase [Hahella ganghwensis]